MGNASALVMIHTSSSNIHTRVHTEKNCFFFLNSLKKKVLSFLIYTLTSFLFFHGNNICTYVILFAASVPSSDNFLL